MKETSSNAYLISIAGEDRVGVVSNVTGYLFEIGANLADTAYAVLGEGFEFSCVADLVDLMTPEELEEGLISLPALKGTRINVAKFPFGVDRPDMGEISHVLEVQGGDRTGLVSRISDVLQQFDSNIVRMNSRRVDTGQNELEYRMRFALNIPADKVTQLDNTLSNVVGSMRLKMEFNPV
ncbi:hypothetical protein QGN29_12855 [Temperatibacter marinus]|uniref:Amino acid-binding protein n=1 Tax=Temperatibacter marinus TaxID=1456591 RepID=A0AA52HA73_9PROT|nr:hypothetical protein [Temperatibacter marinus]WND02435.1 hypothetical protein QGN29_12855 [Temperatibacter marinus]